MRRLIILFSFILLSMAGCSKEAVHSITFNSKIDNAQLWEYEGEMVTINGFLAAVDTDETSGYLVPRPYSAHLDFEENSTAIVDCLMFIMPEGLTYQSSDLPITVTGILRISEYTDSMDYTAYIYIDEAVVTNYTSDQTDIITVYTELAKGGFIASFDTYMSTIYSATNYEELGEKPEALDANMFSDLYLLVKDHTEDIYSSPKQLVIDGMALVKSINDALVENDQEALSTLNESGQTLYNDFYEWLKDISF